MKSRLPLLLSLLASPVLLGAIKTERVEYRDGDTVLEGFVAYDDARAGKRPGILVVHQWMGLTDYEKKRCEMLAELGYVAFAADIYGKGVRPANPGEAGGFAGKYKGDRPLLRRRVNAGLEKLKTLETCNTAKTAAIGYCFGGTGVLELARSGADVAGVVSFHGGLASPTPSDASRIRGKVLALHGADDPYVPAAEVTGFEKEMRDAKCDWQRVAYGGAVHSFTHWTAGTDNSKGAAYNEKADLRSWAAMKSFFAELFR
jgi:dienelactone hydrolase